MGRRAGPGRGPRPILNAAAVVLAAGAGRRFRGDGHKLLARWRDRPLAWWSLAHAAEAGLARTWVVTGAVDLTGAGVVPPGVEVLENPQWHRGLASSLQVALAAAGGAGLDAVVVGLGDQPAIPATAWRAVAEAPGGPIAVATYGGRRRNPVRLDREIWDLLPLDGDEGARALIAGRPDLVSEVACEGEPADIDTVEDLARWS